MVGAVARVVVGDDGLERGLLLLRGLLVVGLFLGQVFLDLLHVLVALRRRREDAGDVQRLEGFVFGLPLGLNLLNRLW